MTYRQICFNILRIQGESLCIPSPATLVSNSEVHLLAFYVCAVAFVVALTLTGYLHSAWREVSRVVTMVIAAFAVWSFLRFLRIADERQTRINYQALGFAFILALAVSLLGGFVGDLAHLMFPGWVYCGCYSFLEYRPDCLFLAVPMKTRLRVLRAEKEWSQAEYSPSRRDPPEHQRHRNGQIRSWPRLGNQDRTAFRQAH